MHMYSYNLSLSCPPYTRPPPHTLFFTVINKQSYAYGASQTSNPFKRILETFLTFYGLIHMTNDALCNTGYILLLESSNVLKIDGKNLSTWSDKSAYSELIACSNPLFKTGFYFLTQNQKIYDQILSVTVASPLGMYR